VGVIEFVEVGPRDGLQNEALILPTAQKIALIERALDAGARRIEVASFVRTDRVPQMADAEAVVAALPQRGDVSYIGLVLNMRGALRAIETGIHEIGAVCAASDTFGLRNQGQDSASSLAGAKQIVEHARASGRMAQITIAVAFGCPFEGEIAQDKVIAMARDAASAGPIDIAIADTIGVASPAEVARLVAAVARAVAPLPVRTHFHNTRNTGLANVWTAVQAGSTIVDAAIGGLGGCPFAPRATGNVPSEDVVYMLERAGVSTGMKLGKLIDAAQWLSDVMGKDLPGMTSKAGLFPMPAPMIAHNPTGSV
jgi:hydroxymethylglutaryl-CoA lyase